MPMSDRATNLLALFQADGIGTRPLVFVAHSLGGLIVKQLLRNADTYGPPPWKQIVSQTRGVVFLATPHQGTRLANYIGTLRQIFRLTTAVTEMEASASALRDLDTWYRENVSQLRNPHAGLFRDVYVVRAFRTWVWQFKRVSGSSGLKVQAAIACWCRRRLCSMVFRLMVSLRLSMAGPLPK